MSKKQVKKGPNGVKLILLRLPDRVAKGLKERADSQKRSVNSQIIYELDTPNG